MPRASVELRVSLFLSRGRLTDRRALVAALQPTLATPPPYFTSSLTAMPRRRVRLHVARLVATRFKGYLL
jgi:hypothetical protein